MEYEIIDKDIPPIERFYLDMIALGTFYKDMPNPAPKDLKEDITNKWKLEELEYQQRRAQLISEGVH